MSIWIVIVAAVTVFLCTVLTCAAIAARQKRPCHFHKTYVIVGQSKIGDGIACKGLADNVWLSADIRFADLNDVRVCDAHVGHLMDLADKLARQTSFE